MIAPLVIGAALPYQELIAPLDVELDNRPAVSIGDEPFERSSSPQACIAFILLGIYAGIFVLEKAQD